MQELNWPEEDKRAPKLNIRPMITDHKNIFSYFRNFSPLLLYEAWVALGRNCEINVKHPTVFQILVKDQATQTEGRNEHEYLLNCQAIFQPTQRLSEFDLITMSMQEMSLQLRNPDKSKLLFGIVGTTKYRPKMNIQTNTLDPRLVASAENSFRRPLQDSDYIVNFQLQVKKIPSPSSLDKIYTVARMSSLRAIFMKRLSLNTELDNSPLGGIILEPSKHESAFTMIPCTASPRLNSDLNATQHSAVQSVAQSITQSREPKIALIEGPPGKNRFALLIVRFIRVHYLSFSFQELAKPAYS